MKKLLPVILLAVFCAVSATTPDTSDYIRQYSLLAVSEMNRSGIPASITMAQAILESASGKSRLATVANNHFGIKCGSSWDGGKEYFDDDVKNECFRVYPSVDASWKDHTDFLLSSPRYIKLFSYGREDYKAWARGLSECGYATDRRYAGKLIKLIEEYRLYELDREQPAEPDSTGQVSVPAAVRKPAETVLPIIDEEVTVDFERPVLYENGRPYVLAAEGDSFASLAREFGLFKSQILRWNGFDRKAELVPGTRIYIRKARSGK